MIEQLLEYDTQLFLFLNNLGTSNWDAFWLFYTGKFNWIPLYILLVYILFKKLPLKLFLITLVVITLMITFTDQITNLFKHGFERFRPCHNTKLNGLMRLVKPHCGGQFGYFSGHSSNTMALAVFMGLLLQKQFKYLIFLMLFWAALMGYSRIYVGVHYPLDVVSGMLFGALSGFSFYKLISYLQKRLNISPVQK